MVEHAGSGLDDGSLIPGVSVVIEVTTVVSGVRETRPDVDDARDHHVPGQLVGTGHDELVLHVEVRRAPVIVEIELVFRIGTGRRHRTLVGIVVLSLGPGVGSIQHPAVGKALATLEDDRLVLRFGIGGELHDLVEVRIVRVVVVRHVDRTAVRRQLTGGGTDVLVEFALEVLGLRIDQVNAQREIGHHFTLVSE